MDHSLGEPFVWVQSHVPVDSTFGFEHHRVIPFNFKGPPTAFGKENKEQRIRVREALRCRRLQLRDRHSVRRSSTLLNHTDDTVKSFRRRKCGNLFFLAISPVSRVPDFDGPVILAELKRCLAID